MPRGTTPRRPARTGRQDRVDQTRVGRTGLSGKPNRKQSARDKSILASIPKASKETQSPKKKSNPLAPERIAEILKRLDQLYPNVTCALTHSNAWELLVATILSAQSTDVNVN